MKQRMEYDPTPSPEETTPVQPTTVGELPEQIMVDTGDYNRNGNPDEIFLRSMDGDANHFDICRFGCCEIDANEVAHEIRRRYNAFPAMLEALRDIAEITKQQDVFEMATNAIQSATK